VRWADRPTIGVRLRAALNRGLIHGSEPLLFADCAAAVSGPCCGDTELFGSRGMDGRCHDVGWPSQASEQMLIVCLPAAPTLTATLLIAEEFIDC